MFETKTPVKERAKIIKCYKQHRQQSSKMENEIKTKQTNKEKK